MLYLDTSALVKLVRPEPETAELCAWLDDHSEQPLATSALAEVELPRALLRLGEDDRLTDAIELLADLLVVEIDQPVRTVAHDLSGPAIRSLDAIHLATAYELRPDLTAIVTYDQRMAAAVDPAVPVASPGATVARTS